MTLNKVFPTVLGALLTAGVAAGTPTVVSHWHQYADAQRWNEQLWLGYGVLCVLLVVFLVVQDAVLAWRGPVRDTALAAGAQPAVLHPLAPDGFEESEILAQSAD